MRPNNFWKTIRQHPWLLMVLLQEVEESRKCHSEQEFALELAELPDNVEFMASRPLKKSVLSESNLEVECRPGVVGKLECAQKSWSWYVIWHFGRVPRFNLRTPVGYAETGSTFTHISGETVSDAIRRIRSKHPHAVIDAVCRCVSFKEKIWTGEFLDEPPEHHAIDFYICPKDV